MTNSRTIMIVAGEASGDRHAAKLVRAMIESEPSTDFHFFGAAGPKMRAAGVEAVVRADELSVVGIAEIAKVLPMFLTAFRDLKRSASNNYPDVAILVDFPEFNLKLAKSLKKRGFKVIYYISPQIWAWRKYRISTIKKYVDLVISILPFEKEWYRKNGVVNVEFVGNPLAKEVHPTLSKVAFCLGHGLSPDRQIVSLLPGSRRKEIAKILPVMIESVRSMLSIDPELQFIIPVAHHKHRALVDEEITSANMAQNSITVVESETYDALNASDAAAVTSGTATLETGIIGTPMVVVYKTSNSNYRLLEPFIKVPHYGLINLIAEKRIAVEMIQDDLTTAALSSELFRLLEPAVNAESRKELGIATEKLGHGGASKRAAQAILKIVNTGVQ